MSQFHNAAGAMDAYASTQAPEAQADTQTSFVEPTKNPYWAPQDWGYIITSCN